MPTLAATLRHEIRRLAKAEVARALRPLARMKKQVKSLRLGSRGSRRALASLERGLRRLSDRLSVQSLRARTRRPSAGPRVAPRVIRALRDGLHMTRREFAKLLGDGNLLLAELRQRQAAIHALLTGTQALAVQLSGLVNDNQAKLGPALAELNQVTTVLAANQANLKKALALAGPYYRLLGNALGNGRWFDTYLCGLIPKSYLPPGTGPATGCEPPKP